MSDCRQIGQNIFPKLSDLGLTNRWVSRSDVWTSSAPDMIQRSLSILMWEVTLVMKKSKIEFENHSEYWNISQQVDMGSQNWCTISFREMSFENLLQYQCENTSAGFYFQKIIPNIGWVQIRKFKFQFDIKSEND